MASSIARVLGTAGLVLAMLLAACPASALTIELKDVAPDRIERQRAAAEGQLPLPNTPNVAALDLRLREKGVSLAAPMLIRIFKSESELEVWKLKDGAFALFATYPICQWSGTTGPKLKSGDKQAPEGFYTLTRAQLYHVGRWPKSLNLGFPNVYDQALARTGSSILVHGGCSSVGCFAMTNPVMDEIHSLAASASGSGQDHIPVHVFPFRMTDANMKANSQSAWTAFWVNLKRGYDAFESTKRAPRVSVCDGIYQFEELEKAVLPGAISVCSGMYAELQQQNRWLNNLEAPEPGRVAFAASPALSQKLGENSAAADAASARKLYRCPVSLPTCHRYFTAWHGITAKRMAYQLRGSAARRTWVAQEPPG